MKNKPAASFTPGPWKVTCAETDYVEVSAGEGRFFTVAKVTGFSMPEAEANAALIAAAPELLEVVKEFKAVMESSNPTQKAREDYIHQCNCIIAAAEGRK